MSTFTTGHGLGHTHTTAYGPPSTHGASIPTWDFRAWTAVGLASSSNASARSTHQLPLDVRGKSAARTQTHNTTTQQRAQVIRPHDRILPPCTELPPRWGPARQRCGCSTPAHVHGHRSAMVSRTTRALQITGKLQPATPAPRVSQNLCSAGSSHSPGEVASCVTPRSCREALLQNVVSCLGSLAYLGTPISRAMRPRELTWRPLSTVPPVASTVPLEAEASSGQLAGSYVAACCATEWGDGSVVRPLAHSALRVLSVLASTRWTRHAGHAAGHDEQPRRCRAAVPGCGQR